jgi:hypothetical protein
MTRLLTFIAKLISLFDQKSQNIGTYIFLNAIICKYNLPNPAARLMMGGKAGRGIV